jgi:hypothetical protein
MLDLAVVLVTGKSQRTHPGGRGIPRLALLSRTSPIPPRKFVASAGDRPGDRKTTSSPTAQHLVLFFLQMMLVDFLGEDGLPQRSVRVIVFIRCR